jgi:hypothetical protein
LPVTRQKNAIAFLGMGASQVRSRRNNPRVILYTVN